MSRKQLPANSHEVVSTSPRAERLREQFDLLTPGDLAALIGVDLRTLGEWRARGAGPDVTRLGRAIFYRRSDVETWIDLKVMPSDRTIC